MRIIQRPDDKSCRHYLVGPSFMENGCLIQLCADCNRSIALRIDTEGRPTGETWIVVQFDRTDEALSA